MKYLRPFEASYGQPGNGISYKEAATNRVGGECVYAAPGRLHLAKREQYTSAAPLPTPSLTHLRTWSAFRVVPAVLADKPGFGGQSVDLRGPRVRGSGGVFPGGTVCASGLRR